VKIERHLQRVRRDNIRKRKRRQRTDLRSLSPLLQRDVESGRRQDFLRLLRPLLGFLPSPVERRVLVACGSSPLLILPATSPESAEEPQARDPSTSGRRSSYGGFPESETPLCDGSYG